ncbi:MAG: hypothetical protein IPK10_15555 [Bacteroidetes bacterium]|nr:hypothetical protein [Bacteroidota bacterium]
MKRDKSLIIWAGIVTMLVVISCGHKHASNRTSAAPEIAYFCPMDSMINEAKSGHCTVCGMNLIKNPNYTGEELIEVVITSTGDTLVN